MTTNNIHQKGGGENQKAVDIRADAIKENAQHSIVLPVFTPTQLIEREKMELSNLIWNQSGKHTHTDLDKMIGSTIRRVLEGYKGEIEKWANSRMIDMKKREEKLRNEYDYDELMIRQDMDECRNFNTALTDLLSYLEKSLG